MRPSPEVQARLLMQAVALLHARGFGRLRLYGYVKEGLGVWRHVLFAADTLPASIGRLPLPCVHGSLPGEAVSPATTAEAVADDITARFPELLEAARGEDAPWVQWYRELLAAHPHGVLELESPHEARMAGRWVVPPAFAPG
jgi:hypothetical protein